MKDKGFDLTKEENWKLQDKAFEFLNDSIAIDFDRSYEQQMMRVNIIVAMAGYHRWQRGQSKQADGPVVYQGAG